MNAASILSVQVLVDGMRPALAQIDSLETRLHGAAGTAGKAADDMAAAGAAGGSGFAQDAIRGATGLEGDLQRAAAAAGDGAANKLAGAGDAAGSGFAQDAVRGANGLDGDMSRVANAAGDGAANKLADSGEDGGKGFADGASSGIGKLKDVFKLGGAAAGAAGAAALAYGLSSAMDMEAGNDKLAAQLGLTKDESARIGKAAGELYADNYGESLDQVNEAIRGVMQQVGGMRNASMSDLKDIAGTVLNLASTFDQDLGGTTAAVGQMIKTGLVKDAKEATDVLTVGFQHGADKAGDLLDTFNEYGTQFRKFGLDGKTSMGLLSQGLQAGARDADLVADSIKEFSLRSQGNIEQTDSKGVAHLTALGQAFQNLGFDGYKVQETIAKGGPGAAQALDQVLDKLRSVKDPADRSAYAVTLFGTQAEDMGDALYALDPSKAVDTLGKVGGAADKMGDTLSDNASAKIETFKRKALMGLTNVVGGQVLPALERMAPAATAMANAVGNVAEDVTGWLTDLFDSIDVEGLKGDLDAAQSALGNAADFIRAVFDAIGPGIKRTLGGLVDMLRGAVELISAILNGDFGAAWDAIKRIVSGAINQVLGELQGAVGLFKAATGGLLSGAIDGVMGAIGGVLEAAKTVLVDAPIGVIHGAVGIFTGVGGWVVGQVATGVKGVGGFAADVGGWVKNKVVEGIHGGADAVTGAGGWVVNRVEEGVKGAAGFAADVGGWIKNRVVDGIHDTVDGITGVGGWVTNRVGDGLRGAAGFAGDAGGWIKNRVVDGIHNEIDGIKTVGGWVTDKVVDGIKSVGGVAADIGGWVKDKIEAIPGVIGGAAKAAGETILKAIVSGLTGAAGLAKQAANTVIRAINEAIPNKVNIPGLPDVNIPDNPIPYLARGARNFIGGMAVVGEKGAELVCLPGGTDVFSHQESKAMLAPTQGPVLSAPMIHVAAPEVRLYVDGEEFRGMVRVEIAESDRAAEATFNAGALA